VWLNLITLPSPGTVNAHAPCHVTYHRGHLTPIYPFTFSLSGELRRRLGHVITHSNVFFDPLFLDCHAIGNDFPFDRDELGSVLLNRTCGHSTSAWCQLGNGLRIVNGGSGQWKRLRSRMGHALDAWWWWYMRKIAFIPLCTLESSLRMCNITWPVHRGTPKSYVTFFDPE